MSRNDVNRELTLNTVSCFVINAAIMGLVGTVKSAFRLKDGTLLIETKNRSQADKLLKLKELYGPVKIEIKEHPTLNLTKGVVSCFDFTFLSDEEILDGLKSQGVVAIKRIQRKERKDKEIIYVNTNSAILTFKLPMLPERISVAFHSCRVRIFVPNPLRCFGCQNYGHPALSCEKPKICGKCAEGYHDPEPCNKPEKCTNCNEGHVVWSRQCPVFKEESEVLRKKVEKKITYRAARRKFLMENPIARIHKRPPRYCRTQ